MLIFRPKLGQLIEKFVSGNPNVFRKFCTTLMVILSTVDLNIEGCLSLEKDLPGEFYLFSALHG